MNTSVASRFDSLEKRREALIARVLVLTPIQQISRPDAKAFSPAEVIEHFALTEAFNLGFLQKTPPSTLSTRKASASFVFKNSVRTMLDASNHVSTLPVMTPKGKVDLAASAKKWESVRSSTKEYLDQVDDPCVAFAKMLWFFGTLSACDFLTLLEAHMHYHETRFPKV